MKLIDTRALPIATSSTEQNDACRELRRQRSLLILSIIQVLYAISWFRRIRKVDPAFMPRCRPEGMPYTRIQVLIALRSFWGTRRRCSLRYGMLPPLVRSSGLCLYASNRGLATMTSSVSPMFFRAPVPASLIADGLALRHWSALIRSHIIVSPCDIVA